MCICLRQLVVVILIFSNFLFARDPLTDKSRDGAGTPTTGLGQRLTDLPDTHPAKVAFNQMLLEIVRNGGHVQEKDFGAFTFANHTPAGPNKTVFRYNPNRLRAIDAMEEVLHWEQIKEGGAYWRDYSNHPLFKRFKNKMTIMEDLAKKNLLQRTDLPFVIREELKQDLMRVHANTYSLDLTGQGASFSKTACPVTFERITRQ